MRVAAVTRVVFTPRTVFMEIHVGELTSTSMSNISVFEIIVSADTVSLNTVVGGLRGK